MVAQRGRRRQGGLDDGDLHAVDWRQGLEQAAPLLAAVAPDPELTGRGAEVEGWRRDLVDRHRVAQDREVAGLLREAAGEPPPGVAAVLAAPDRGRATRAGARGTLEWHDVDRVGVFGMHDD